MKQQVLIIGSGPSGMVSALCLARLGVSCLVIERQSGVNLHPKAHELNTRSIEILESIGVSIDELRAEAAPFSDGARILFCSTVNEEFGRIDLYDDPERRQKYKQHLKSETPYLNLSQTELEKILLRHLNAHPLIEIRFNQQWESLIQNEYQVTSTLLDLKDQSSDTVTTQFVIAADGANSRCRQFIGISMDGPDKIDDFASAYFETNLRSHIQIPAKLYWVINPMAAGTFIAHHIEKRWVYMVPAYLNYERKEDFTKEFFERRIKNALGDESLDIDVKSINFWHMSAQIASAYRNGRVLLAGDAAHRFPPTGGLGMNTGIADAHNLAWKLKMTINGEAGEALLDTYEKERRPIAIQNTEESVYNYHKIMEVLEAFGLDRNGLEKLARVKNSPPLKWLPNSWKMSLIDMISSFIGQNLQKFHRDPDFRERILATIADQIAHFDRIGLDIGYIYEDGAIISDGTMPLVPENRVTDYIPSTWPGSRFPHFPISTGPSLYSSHDLLVYGRFTLLIRVMGEAWMKAAKILPQQVQDNLDIINIDDLKARAEDYEAYIKLCNIESSGAILIRPDGHVAWRIVKFSGDATSLVQSVFESLLNKK